MKKILIVPALAVSCWISSCKKDVNNITDQQATASAQSGKAAMQPGNVFATCDAWHISSFTQNETNLTDDYKQLNFIFCPGNTFTVSNDILSESGSWYILLDKGNPGYLDINLNDDSPVSFWNDIEGRWKINSMDENMIRLQSEDGSRIMVLQRGK